MAEPRLRRPTGDGHRLALHQRLHLHLRQPGSRPGEDGRARRPLREARRLLLRELGRAVREVAHEDGRAHRRARRAARPAARRVRAGRGRVRRPGDELLRRPRCLPPRAPAPRRHVAAPLRVPAPRLRRVHDLRRAVQGEPAGHPRPAHRADGRGSRRAPVQARRRVATPRTPRHRNRRRLGVRRGTLAGGDRHGAGREASTTRTGVGSTIRGSPTRR